MDVERLVKKYGIDRKANVVGYSLTLKPKITAGKETGVMAIRIYVSKKLPLSALKAEDVIPQELEGVKTDVVEVGPLKALAVDKTKPFRPLMSGISIGHWSITAGTLAIPFISAKDGETYLASNAHVLVDDPTKEPREVAEKRICQPGPCDIAEANLGDKSDFVVGEYAWHQKIYPIGEESSCAASKLITRALNSLMRALGRKTRFIAVTEADNYVDFAVFRLKPGISYQLAFPKMSVERRGFIGLLFAGSDISTVICKAKYMIELGYIPAIEPAEASEGDTIEKEGRTTCHTVGKVLDASAVVTVSYGGFDARFRDVIMSDIRSSGGDSGSPVFKARA